MNNNIHVETNIVLLTTSLSIICPKKYANHVNYFYLIFITEILIIFEQTNKLISFHHIWTEITSGVLYMSLFRWNLEYSESLFPSDIWSNGEFLMYIRTPLSRLWHQGLGFPRPNFNAPIITASPPLMWRTWTLGRASQSSAEYPWDLGRV